MNLSEVENIRKKNFQKAIYGRKLWKQLKNQHHFLTNDAMIFVTMKEKSCAIYATSLLSDFLRLNHLNKALFITDDLGFDQYIKKYCKPEIDVIVLNRHEIDCIFAFYNANLRDDNFVVASLTIPEGRILNQYLKTGRIGERMLFARAVYNIDITDLSTKVATSKEDVDTKRYWMRKIGSSSLAGLIVYYLMEVCEGERYYKKLKKKYGDDTTILFCPHTGTGDIYNIGQYFEKYLHKKHLGNYIFLFMGKSEQKVGDLFGIHGSTELSRRNALRLVRFAQFIGTSNLDMIQMHHYPPAPQAHVHTDLLEGYNGLTFHETYKYVTMEMDKEIMPDNPQFTEDTDVGKVFQRSGLVKGKTVIIAPYSTSANIISPSTWERIVEMLITEGFSVATNCASSKEVPIEGSVELRFSYQHTKSYLEYAGYFIGTRSGFCDVISSVKECKIIVLTYIGSEGVAWLASPGKTMAFYGMQNNYGNDSILEIEFTDEADDQILQTLTDVFKS